MLRDRGTSDRLSLGGGGETGTLCVQQKLLSDGCTTVAIPLHLFMELNQLKVGFR
jgi:hypothetical protein